MLYLLFVTSIDPSFIQCRQLFSNLSVHHLLMRPITLQNNAPVIDLLTVCYCCIIFLFYTPEKSIYYLLFLMVRMRRTTANRASFPLLQLLTQCFHVFSHCHTYIFVKALSYFQCGFLFRQLFQAISCFFLQPFYFCLCFRLRFRQLPDILLACQLFLQLHLFFGQ